MMVYFFIAFIMFLVGAYVIYGIQIESSGQVINKNDERWKAVVAKSDSVALNSFYILSMIMAFLTIGGDVLRRFEIVRELLSEENLFELYKTYSLCSLCIIFAIRTVALKHYNKKM